MRLLDQEIKLRENLVYSLNRYPLWWIILIITIFFDFLSTSVFVLGVDDGLKLIGTLPDYESIVIDAAGQVFYSDGLTQPGEALSE